jgi:hypothetical protein
MDNIAHHQLNDPAGSKKPMFMVHQSWLEMNDMWRRRGDLFDGTYEIRGPPRKRSGTEIDTLLKNREQCLEPGKKQKAPDPLLRVWKTRPVFWDLSY